MPSLWYETFGIVAAEAMSHGVPVVASRLGALACLVNDEVDGLLFEPGNARALAGALTRLWNDPVLCRKLGAAARLKACSLWTPERHLEGVLGVYDAVVPARRGDDGLLPAPRAAQPLPAGAPR
jgi:glycosyltransferase involved in cell wall biosynthesis